MERTLLCVVGLMIAALAFDLAASVYRGRNMKQGVIDNYEKARLAMLAETQRLFPDGCRVRPIGTTSGNWGARVRALDAYTRREISADMVFLDFDNGNKYAVSVTGLEAA